MRTLVPRLLALFLAVLPAIWGTCPCWIMGAGSCGGGGAGLGSSVGKSGPARCPCCARKDCKAPAGHAPGRDDQRRNGCDGCPVLEVRHGATQAPAAIGLPDFDVIAWAVMGTPVALWTSCRGASDAVAVCTGPPPRLEPVCERLVGTLRQLV